MSPDPGGSDEKTIMKGSVSGNEEKLYQFIMGNITITFLKVT